MASLTGKRALVTGSSRGIGRAIAERVAAEGAAVCVTYAGSADKAAEVVRGIERVGGRAFAAQVDMRDPAQVRAAFDACDAHFGGLDLFVHNAAGTNVFKPTAALTLDDYDSMFLITRGCYVALGEVAKRLTDGGRVVCISTGGTAMAMAGGGAYAGSKAAIEQFCMCLAKELGPRQITVNTVRPGVTKTDGLVLGPEQIAGLVSQTPMGRLGEPQDVADAVLLLLSHEARWVTGQNIAATGGIL